MRTTLVLDALRPTSTPTATARTTASALLDGATVTPIDVARQRRSGS
jgi:hypothetical protein